MGVVIAIDHGTKKTGFAVTDSMRIITEPLDVFHGTGESLLGHIAGLCDERNVERFVIGMPFDMDGTESGRAAEVRVFGEQLTAFLGAKNGPGFTPIPITYQDERLSTKEADSLLVEAGYTGEARKIRRDSWSALVFLREWLSSGEPGD
ncbi:MAG: Holliday junction resolvase RuvX [Planctomycetota bacterium]|nr:Holliday junction resolvase RuvX [Planctomycetota bacterium]MDG2142355.1 Holliday junction resolvase RuvX [Planctomycetota bacterium]